MYKYVIVVKNDMYNNLVKKFDAIQPINAGTQKLVKLKRKLLIKWSVEWSQEFNILTSNLADVDDFVEKIYFHDKLKK